MKQAPNQTDRATGGWLARFWRRLVRVESSDSSSVSDRPTERDVSMMRRAIDVARAGWDMQEVPVGAVVYRHDTGQVLAEDHNRRESDADPTAHAELLAMRQAAARLGSWRLGGCTLVVTLEPCAMCAGAIVNARVDRVVYGTTDPKAGAVESLYRLCEDRRLNHRPEIVRGVLSDDCRDLLRDFFKQRRRENRLNRRMK